MKITIRETGRKAIIEEVAFVDDSLTYTVIVKGKLYPDSYSIRLRAKDLDHAVKIFDAIESSI